MKKLGVAFGGGGARGLAHVGILRSLRRHGLEPGIVAGTSAGSIAAALYAAGIPQDSLEAEVADFDWFANVIDLSATVRNIIARERGGLLSNSKLAETVNRLVGGKSFDDLDVDLAVVASELEGRQRVIFTSRRVGARLRWSELHRILAPPTPSKPGIETVVIGDFDDIGAAVSASCAIPGLFQPVRIRGLALLDGGLTSQVPVDLVRAMGARVTVGVSLGMSFMPDKVANAASALTGTIAMMGVHQLRRSLDLADFGFQIEGIEHRSLLKARQLDLIALGERDMEARVDALRRLVRRKATSLFSRS